MILLRGGLGSAFQGLSEGRLLQSVKWCDNDRWKNLQRAANENAEQVRTPGLQLCTGEG
jgi:hypothetical protein